MTTRLVLAVVLLAIPTACSGDARTIIGVATAPSCGGGWELEGAEVELRNQSDELIGSATTSSNRLSLFPDLGCGVTFRIDDVPEASFYSVRLGTHDGPNYSIEELEKANWEMPLSLGDTAPIFQEPNKSALCDAATSLNEVANDIPLFNDQPAEWVTGVEQAAHSIQEQGAAYAITGNEDIAQRVAEISSPLVPFPRIRNFAHLNEVFGPANALVPDLCPDAEWVRVEFVEA